MTPAPLELRLLRPEDERSFRAALAEIQNETRPWDFALGGLGDRSFSDYLAMIDGWPRGENLPPCFVPGCFCVGVVDGEVVGRVSVRFQLNDFLARVGGHIGYGVRPSQRGRGYATAMLRQALPICAARGIPRALLTCDLDNVGSIKVIERCGGIFEGLTNDPKLPIQRRRYWIPTA